MRQNYRQIFESLRNVAGGHLFLNNQHADPDDQDELDDDDNDQAHTFSQQYWQVLSTVLTKLDLVITEDIPIQSQAWLNSLQNLQHLVIHGWFLNPPRFSHCSAMWLPSCQILPLDTTQCSTMTSCMTQVLVIL